MRYGSKPKSAFVLTALLVCLGVNAGHTQVVQFRMETTDVLGNPIDAVNVGEQFLLKTYVQQVGAYDAPDKAGVFAAYMDVNFDGEMVTPSADIEHAAPFEYGKSGDFDTPGLLDNIGSFSGSLEPLGIEERYLYSVEFSADMPGEVNFVGSESLSYPHHDVLVYFQDSPVSAREIDFGAADLRLSFDETSIQVMAVPEPQYCVYQLAALILLALPLYVRRQRGRGIG